MQGMRANNHEELVRDVEAAVNSFACLQGEQEASIARGSDLNKLALWGDQRSRAFAKLQHALQQVWQCENAQQDQLLGAMLREKIGTLIQKEQQLFASCSLQKERLAHEMNQARRGKKVLGHYGPGQENKGPTYLSNRL